MTTFKPGDVVERVVDGHEPGDYMALGSRHVVEATDRGGQVLRFKGDRDGGFSTSEYSWHSEYFKLVDYRTVATVGKLRLFPASTALVRNR